MLPSRSKLLGTALVMVKYKTTILPAVLHQWPCCGPEIWKLVRQAGRQACRQVGRQAAARTKDHSLKGRPAGLVYPSVWSRQQTSPFPHQRAPALSRVATADSSSHSSKAPAGEEVCHHFNAGRCHRTDCYYLHKYSITGCGGLTLPAPVPTFLHMNCNEL